MIDSIAREITKLDLAKQSLLLVGILLAGEILFILTLSWQLNLAKQEISKEAHLKELLKQSQKLVYLLNDYEQSLELWAANRDPDLEERSFKCQKEMKQVMQWLLANSAGHKALAADLQNLSDLQGKMFKLIEKAKKRFLTLKEPAQNMAFASLVFQRIQKLRADWEHCSVNLLHNEASLLNTFPEIESRRRRQLELLTWTGVAANILVVLFLALCFLKAIASRISILLANTRAIANKAELNQLVYGADEIARLDKVMHDMASALESAQQERQAFLAMVSHELRTPLTSIKMAVELMQIGAAGKIKPEAQECLAESDKIISKLISLITDLLDLEKMEAGKLVLDKKSTYLEFAISKAAEHCQPIFEERGLSLEVPETNLEVLMEPDRIAQVIRIFLLNAAQNSEHGKRVRIELEDLESEILLSVKDWGCGVPDYMRGQMFERFRRCENTSDGIASGMGLPIARRIIESHGGEIGFSDNPEGGAVFFFKLPRG